MNTITKEEGVVSPLSTPSEKSGSVRSANNPKRTLTVSGRSQRPSTKGFWRRLFGR
jgi:hypothetical protein